MAIGEATLGRDDFVIEPHPVGTTIEVPEVEPATVALAALASGTNEQTKPVDVR